MARHLIRHYGKYLYRHEDYLGICDGDDCAGQILSLFEFWTICRIQEIKRIESYNEQARRNKMPLMQVPDPWLYEKIEDIKKGILETYGDTSIRKSLKSLKEKGFISDRPSKNEFDRTKEYLFHADDIQKALDNWNKSKTIEKSDLSKITVEPSDLSMESSKITVEPSDLKDDLYSSNSLNKQSSINTRREGISDLEDLKEALPPSLSYGESIPKTTVDPKIKEDCAAPRSFDNLEQLNEIEKERFLSGRRTHPIKKTFLSSVSDPWMKTANNTDEDFAQWVYEKRYKAKGGLLSDAKAEIKNNCERAADLWSEYQSEKQQKEQAQQQLEQARSLPAPMPVSRPNYKRFSLGN